MKRLILLALMLAGCAGPSQNALEQKCGGADRPFPETWPCVKGAIASGRGQADLKRYYIATGDVVAEQISAGQITEAQGRLTMAKAASDIHSTALARYNGDSGSGVAVYQRVGPGTVVRY